MSTDDKVVKDLALISNVEVPFFPRPAEISTDCDTALVIDHCLRFLEEKEGYKPSHVCLLQPTSPFRLPEDVDNCVEIAERTGCDTVVSVCQVRQFPQWMFTKLEGGVLKPFLGIDLKGDVLVSQTLPQNIMYPNGGVYVVRREVLMEKGRIFGEDIRGYEMPPTRSIDLETELDFNICEALIEKYGMPPWNFGVTPAGKRSKEHHQK